MNVPSVSLEANPQPDQVVLIVDVSGTTLTFDLKFKAPLYAASRHS